MLDPNLAYFWISLPFPRHAINPQKTSASEGTLLLFHAGAFPLLLICYVCDIYIYIFHLSACLWFWNNITCYPIYMMLLLYFRRVTEKKTPLLRNHSICSGPQRFPFVLIILLSETSISNGLALKSHPKLLLSRHRITCQRLEPDLTEDLFALLS